MIQSEVRELRLEAREGIQLQPTVVLPDRPGLREVGSARSGPHGRFSSLKPKGSSSTPRRPAATSSVVAPWALAGRRLVRNKLALWAQASSSWRSSRSASRHRSTPIALRIPIRSSRTLRARYSSNGKTVQVIQQGGGKLGLGETPVGTDLALEIPDRGPTSWDAT
jgi:hypothetical protein